MKKKLSGLFAALALSCGALAFGETEDSMKEQPAAEAPKLEQQAPQQTEASEANAPSGEEIRAMPARPKDLDLRHCLELKDEAAIAKCAGE